MYLPHTRLSSYHPKTTAVPVKGSKPAFRNVNFGEILVEIKRIEGDSIDLNNDFTKGVIARFRNALTGDQYAELALLAMDELTIDLLTCTLETMKTNCDCVTKLLSYLENPKTELSYTSTQRFEKFNPVHRRTLRELLSPSVEGTFMGFFRRGDNIEKTIAKTQVLIKLLKALKNIIAYSVISNENHNMPLLKRRLLEKIPEKVLAEPMRAYVYARVMNEFAHNPYCGTDSIENFINIAKEEFNRKADWNLFLVGKSDTGCSHSENGFPTEQKLLITPNLAIRYDSLFAKSFDKDKIIIFKIELKDIKSTDISQALENKLSQLGKSCIFSYYDSSDSCQYAWYNPEDNLVYYYTGENAKEQSLAEFLDKHADSSAGGRASTNYLRAYSLTQQELVDHIKRIEQAGFSGK